ncbi:hypothetical protein [Natrinema soli]|uniref:Uncharacterized protein n=1 Tax=Natrinema soli TaxID=1930624 RepID=A0ABD5SKS7_9EURY|nr:hypothetical protein [Natrinema soli]
MTHQNQPRNDLVDVLEMLRSEADEAVLRTPAVSASSDPDVTNDG